MNVLHDNLMVPRRDWNRLGPHIPCWWKLRLRRIDPQLALQFMPAADPGHYDEGIDRRFFPNGVWVICRKLKRSGLLFKQWVWSLTRPNEPWRPPGYDVLRLIHMSRNLHRHHRLHEIEDHLDRCAEALGKEGYARQRRWLCEQVADTCRKLSISKRSLGVPRFSMAGAYK